ncbi:MAG: hypothetical protein QXQ87_04655 [Halobacteria archaeon]
MTPEIRVPRHLEARGTFLLVFREPREVLRFLLAYLPLALALILGAPLQGTPLLMTALLLAAPGLYLARRRWEGRTVEQRLADVLGFALRPREPKIVLRWLPPATSSSSGRTMAAGDRHLTRAFQIFIGGARVDDEEFARLLAAVSRVQVVESPSPFPPESYKECVSVEGEPLEEAAREHLGHFRETVRREELQYRHLYVAVSATRDEAEAEGAEVPELLEERVEALLHFLNDAGIRYRAL